MTTQILLPSTHLNAFYHKITELRETYLNKTHHLIEENPYIKQSVGYVQNQYNNVLELKEKVQTNTFNLVDNILKKTEDKFDSSLKQIQLDYQEVNQENIENAKDSKISTGDNSESNSLDLQEAPVRSVQQIVQRLRSLGHTSVLVIRILISQSTQTLQNKVNLNSTYTQVGEQLENATVLTILTREYLQQHLFAPSLNLVNVYYNASKDKVLVSLQTLQNVKLNELAPQLKQNFAILQEQTGIQLALVKQKTEYGIQVSREQFLALKAQLSAYLAELLQRVQTLKLQEVKQGVVDNSQALLSYVKQVEVRQILNQKREEVQKTGQEAYERAKELLKQQKEQLTKKVDEIRNQVENRKQERRNAEQKKLQ